MVYHAQVMLSNKKELYAFVYTGFIRDYTVYYNPTSTTAICFFFSFLSLDFWQNFQKHWSGLETQDQFSKIKVTSKGQIDTVAWKPKASWEREALSGFIHLARREADRGWIPLICLFLGLLVTYFFSLHLHLPSLWLSKKQHKIENLWRASVTLTSGKRVAKIESTYPIFYWGIATKEYRISVTHCGG